MKAFIAVAAVGLALPGCVSYTARVAREVKRGAVDVEVVSVRARRARPAETRMDVVVREIPAGTRLRSASLRTKVDPILAPAICTGFPASRLDRAPAADSKQPLVPGEHLTLAFEELSVDAVTARDPHLELLLETPGHSLRCVPIPLTDRGGELTWTPDQRFTVGLYASGEGYTRWLGPVSETFTIQVELGAWLGRFHLAVAGGYGAAGCSSPCPEPSDKSKVNFTSVWPFSLGVRTPLWERGELSLGMGLRYRVVRLAADTYQGHEAFWSQGPFLTPYFGASIAKSPAGGSRNSLMGLEIPVGYVLAGDGRRAVNIGAALTTVFTAF